MADPPWDIHMSVRSTAGPPLRRSSQRTASLRHHDGRRDASHADTQSTG